MSPKRGESIGHGDVEYWVNEIKCALDTISFNNGGRSPGAIDGLTMKLCDQMDSMTEALTRIADALETRGPKD